jgi:putative transposase
VRGYSQRRACGLVGLHPKVYRYASIRPDDSALQIELKKATSRLRQFGDRHLGLLLLARHPAQPSLLRATRR